MRTRIRSLALLIAALFVLPGCTSVNTRMKSPMELVRGMAFGDNGLTVTKYRGSDRAREWAMNEHAESRQRQAAELARQQATAAGKTKL